MLKVSDPNYKCAHVEALSVVQLFSSGSTSPFLITGVDRTNTDYDDKFVVKLNSNERMTKDARCRELIGAWIAKEIGLNVFEPVFIYISDALAESTKGKEYYRRFKESIGMNFGTRFMENCTTIPHHTFKPEWDKSAHGIMAFDTFIANSDRRVEKENLEIANGRIYVLDHELAFSFILILPMFRNKTPWILDDMDKNTLRNHPFYKRYKGTTIDFNPVIEQLENINDTFWDAMQHHIPEVWKTNIVENIRTQLTLIKENRLIFARELTKAILI